MTFYFDTSVLVAASVESHPHCSAALQALDSMVSGRHRGYMSAHGLAEVYAVLTRTPFVPTIHPAEAWKILEESLLPHLEVTVLTAREYRALVRECSVEGHIGGRIYDLIHLLCARKAQCDRLYTFNVKDFRALATPDFRDKICAP